MLEQVDPLAALSALIRTHRAMLVGVARREGLPSEDAVECTQEAFATFLLLFLREEVPREEGDWPAYLTVVTRNAARNRRRRHHVSLPHLSLDGGDALDRGEALDRGDSMGGREPQSSSPTPEALLAEAEEHVRLRACVDRLCDTQRSVVLLRLLEERPGEDVAHELGISRSHVDVLLHRARVSIRACMLE